MLAEDAFGKSNALLGGGKPTDIKTGPRGEWHPPLAAPEADLLAFASLAYDDVSAQQSYAPRAL